MNVPFDSGPEHVAAFQSTAWIWDWTAVLGGLPAIPSLVSLGLLAAVVSAVLACGLIRPGAEATRRPTPADHRAPVVTGALTGFGSARPDSTLSGVRTVARRDAVGVQGRASHGSGLSPIDLDALTALRRRIERGEIAEAPSAAQRLAFARWLAIHGRIDG